MKLSPLGLGLLSMLAVGACTGGDDPTPTSTAVATARPAATGTASATPTSVPTAPASTPVVSDPIPGLFREPRFEEPDASIDLGPRPASVFPEHDRLSTVLYDTMPGTVREFGPGTTGLFSPDGQYFVWDGFNSGRNEPATLRALDLESGTIAELGASGGLIRFDSDRLLLINEAERPGRTLAVDIETGERPDFEPRDIKYPERSSSEYFFTADQVQGTGESRYQVFDRVGGELVLTVTGLEAKFASASELVLLVDVGVGLGNIFIVDLIAIDATFVATTRTEPFRFSTIPLVANDDYVVWTPNFCNSAFEMTPEQEASAQIERPEDADGSRGPTMVFDRTDGTLTEITDVTLWIAGFTPDGRMIDGGFGGNALLDPGSLSWDVVLPDGSTDVSWSPDYRYASRGEQPGHGGVCPP